MVDFRPRVENAVDKGTDTGVIHIEILEAWDFVPEAAKKKAFMDFHKSKNYNKDLYHNLTRMR